MRQIGGRAAARTLAAGGAAALAAAAALVQQRVLDAERLYPPRGSFLVVRGIRLHMIDTRGAGPAVLLLHGNGTMLADMEISGLVAAARGTIA